MANTWSDQDRHIEQEYYFVGTSPEDAIEHRDMYEFGDEAVEHLERYERTDGTPLKIFKMWVSFDVSGAKDVTEEERGS